MRPTLRSEEMQQKYSQHLKNAGLEKSCVICNREPLVEFQYWKIIKNHFPYDQIAAVHHMLVPLRHIKETDLSDEEYQELLQLKSSHTEPYDLIIEAVYKTQTIPGHFHLHLIKLK